MAWGRWFRARVLGGGRAVCPACAAEAVAPVRGTRAIERAVERLDRDRMERDAEILAAALMRDLIDAEDFATGASRWR
jgi:hypothetical protein